MKNLKHISAVAACLLLAVSCGQDPSPTGPEVAGGAADKVYADATGFCDQSIHDALESFWNNDDGVIYQLNIESYDCREDILIDATPAAWGPDCEVSLFIPQGAVPEDYPGYPFVEFGIAVPVVGPIQDAASVSYDLFPDGIEFLADVTLTLSWPDWAGDFDAGAARLIQVEPETHDGDTHYRALWMAAPDLAKAPAFPGAVFDIPHFSRWTVIDDCQEWEPCEKSAVSQELEIGCWTAFDPPPPGDLDPLPLIR